MRDYLIGESLHKMLLEAIASSKANNTGHAHQLQQCLVQLANLKPVEDKEAE